MLLKRELNTRLLAAETALRLAGYILKEQSALTLDTLSIAGISRPLALLKTASITKSWARRRIERLSAIITLTDIDS